MLSLFFSVGICRILRYGSSNTSAVEQQVCPRFFSGPSKFGEMRRCERKMLKCNAEFVDIVFHLMFETFWVAPYDLRRDFPALVNFERHARRGRGSPLARSGSGVDSECRLCPAPAARASPESCRTPSFLLGITALRDFPGGPSCRRNYVASLAFARDNRAP